jgi:hypothetical protein
MSPPVVKIPPRLLELGGAVEAPTGLWHVAKSEAATFCGENCGDWPRVARAVERSGIWCGPCLVAAAEVEQTA